MSNNPRINHVLTNTFLKSIFFFLLLLRQNEAKAQIIVDTSLPTDSQVQLNGTRFQIKGGTVNQSQTNLFHSFSQFSLPTNFAAIFNNPLLIENIFVRVTGQELSNIDGLIQANGNASLFLVNPNGISFGPNAAINIGGSFISTTANSIVFNNGSEFSASNPQIIPPLTVSIPVGLQFRQNSNAIYIQNQGHRLFRLGSSPFELIISPILGSDLVPGLQVKKHNTLALIGGSVVSDGGIIQAETGHIELGGISSGLVKIFPTSNGWSFDYTDVHRFGDIRLNQQSLVDVSGQRSGSIQLQGANILVNNGSVVFSQNRGSLSGGKIEIRAAEALDIKGVSANRMIMSQISSVNQGSGEGGDIDVVTPKLTLFNGGRIGTSILQDSSGKAGNITVDAADSIELVGNSLLPALRASQIISETNSFFSGQVGNIDISTTQLNLRDGANIIAGINIGNGSTNLVNIHAAQSILIEGVGAISSVPSIIGHGALAGTGNIGDLNIQTSKLVVKDGANISTSVLGAGNAGDIQINASNSLEIIGQGSEVISSAQLTPLAIAASLGLPSQPTGESGNVTINTPNLIVAQQGQVTVRNDGTGNAGNLLVNGKSIFLNNRAGITASTLSGDGGNIILNVQDGLRIHDNSLVSASAGGVGSGGNITIQANSVDVNSSNIEAITQTGQAGDLNIEASRLVQVSDKSSLSVEATKGGNAGTLSIKSPITNVYDGAEVTVSSPNGQAGNLTISGNQLYLNQGTISAETGKSEEEGANINLNLSDFVILENESLISATASEDANGGNVIINTPFLFVASPTGPNGSDIRADAFEGRGGNILINATGIFGTAERIAIPGNQTNDIDASSQFGSPGQVQLNSTIDPNRGVIQLPEEVVDPNKLVAQNPCKQGRGSQFTRTGRGGLPPTPADNLSGEATQVELVEPAPFDEENQVSEKIDDTQPLKTKKKKKEIIPAQGWVFNEKGEDCSNCL